MEIMLTKDNVMRILCTLFKVEFKETSAGKISPRHPKDKVYWEGNPEPEEGEA